MGSVWLADDTRLHRQVALKTLRAADDDDAPARARLMREARAAAALNHPHIATVYDVLENDGQVVIVFEYVEGETLACGTGTVTAALALAAQGIDRLPLRFKTESGRLLTVNATLEGSRATHIWLCGEGRLVARGVWLEA